MGSRSRDRWCLFKQHLRTEDALYWLHACIIIVYTVLEKSRTFMQLIECHFIEFSCSAALK